jgi:hypothetical protein
MATPVKNTATVASISVLVAALLALLATLGVTVGPWAATVGVLAPVLTGVALFVVDSYVRIVGEENTQADEVKAIAQEIVADAVKAVRGRK